MDLQVIERKGQRTLTTAQVSAAFEVEAKQLLRNFQRNIDRYQEGKHYFSLTGEELKAFKAERQNDDSLKYVSTLYLWTEQGAWLHAKSLNNIKAWQAYSLLVDDYYTIKQVKNLENVIQITNQLELDTQNIKQQIQLINEKIDEQITLTHGEQRSLQKAVASRVYEIENHAQYRPKLFKELYREIKDRFGVSSYKDVRRKDLQSAISYIEHYVPKKQLVVV
ncbi:ORF6N domain-containing protein [Rummeliibacillus sp. NPDC094406]|uniref:ORF6N domain-containing protein n=1 Tax=Rummeliibacillus sp. NPDC094406 TaxID=3364511 RepID=UPI0037F229B3